MFLFRKEKNLSMQQKIMTGFVLAVFSLLTMGAFYLCLAWLPRLAFMQALSQGFFIFFSVFCVTLYIGAQALIHFGFPLYYANDKKCNMTGFQIFIFAVVTQVLLVVLAILFANLLSPAVPMDPAMMGM